MKKLLTGLTGALAVAFTGIASAETLTIGTGTETTSMYPLYYNWNPNHQIFFHVYSYLINRDEKQQLKQGLSDSWKPIDDKTWEIKLRKDVKWHDGSPFTADDVIFTIDESPKIKTPSPGGRYFFNKKFTKIDDYTIHATTGGAYPLMPNDLSVSPIVSKKHGTGKSTADYNSGAAVMGTGPYKFVEWVTGDRVVLEKNSNYWGGTEDYFGQPRWDKIIYKPISSDPSRLAALLNGDVDLIDYVPTTDYQTLKKNPKVAMSEIASNRVIYLFPDRKGPTTPFAKTNDGKEMPNPFHNLKVRKAFSLAINRQAIVDRVMEGLARPAGEMAAPGLFGSNPDLKPDPYDPEQAKKLLAEAGYPDGFQLTFHGPNDRYTNDAKIVEAVAGMLTRVGIKAQVRTEPKATYFSKAKNYSFILVGFGTDTGEASSALTSLIHSPAKEKNLGAVNRAGYSNLEADTLIEAALTELDIGKREKLLQQASRVSMEDYGVITTHYQVNVWAHRPDLSYKARSDERTIGQFVTKK